MVRYKRGAQGLKIVLVMLVFLATISPLRENAPVANAQLDPSNYCAPVLILPFRGSGEEIDSAKRMGPQTYAGGTTTEGWEGETLARLLRRAYSQYPELARVPVLDVPVDEYLAISVIKEVEALSTLFTFASSPVYQSSVNGSRAGVARYYKWVADHPRCAPPKLVLLGYSQGAMAARRTAEIFKGTDVVKAVITVGDPYQKANADGVSGEGSDGTGTFRARYLFMNMMTDAYYSLPGIRRHSICHVETICSFYRKGAIHFNADPHLNYFKSGVKWVSSSGQRASSRDEVDVYAEILADEVARAGGAPKPPTSTPSRSKETIFVIDTTGSMWGLIDGARVKAADLAQRLLGAPGSKVGLVEYRDHGDAFVARTVVPLTSDYTEFQSGLGRLNADGGGDWPEAVYSGIVEGLRAGWSAGSAKSLIVIGDAPAHDPEPVTGLTSSRVSTLSRGIGTLTMMDPASAPAPAARTATDRSQQPAPVEYEKYVRNTAGALDVADVSGDVEREPVSVYGLAADPTLQSQITDIATATGGRAFDLDGSTSVGEAIDAAIDDIDVRPVAHLGVAEPTIAGATVQFGCAGSVVPLGVASAEIDHDGDGAFDLDCSQGVAEVVYDTPGTRTATLKIVDIEGREATATIQVDVQPQSAGDPELGVDVVDDGEEATGSLGSVLGGNLQSGALGSLWALTGRAGS